MDALNIVPVASLCYDSDATKVFFTQELTTGTEWKFGSTSPIKITTDSTIELNHLVIRYLSPFYQAIDASTSFGSYYRIDAEKDYEIDYGTYIVVGKTWVILNHDDAPMVFIISKEYKITQTYKLVEGKEYYLGRNKDLLIIILDDPSISGRHLYFRPESKKVTIKDMKSRNGTYLKFSTINLNWGTRFIIRIGVETFLKIELKDPKDSAKKLEPSEWKDDLGGLLRVRNKLPQI